MVKVAPSILAADMNNLENEIKDVIEAGGDYIHIDVMDGRFVCNMTNGIEMLRLARKSSNIILDVHLMVEHPEKYIDDFLEANIITFHVETVCTECANEIIDKLRKNNIKVGMSIKPETSIEEVIPYLDKIDMVLVMTVEPGRGGQALINSTLKKIKKLREIDSNIDIEVDGGINEETAKLVKDAGANILVSGTAIFNSIDRKQTIEKIRR